MVAARAPSAPFSFFGLALAPAGPLFAVERMEEREWIVALDSGTLETRLTFGDFQRGALHGMAVVCDECFRRAASLRHKQPQLGQCQQHR